MSFNSFNPAQQTPPLPTSPALERFLKSMQIGFIEWHDGIGYDLDALKELGPLELKWVESLLISQKDADWRDVDALAALKTGPAIEALKECLQSPNIDVKLFAVKHLREMNVVDRIEEIVVETLPDTKIGGGLTYALALAKQYPSERIRQKVLWCSLNGNNDIRVHCAAMALFLYGKTSSEFDMNYKIIFEFRTPDRSQRLAPYEKLCEWVGVDPESII
jgi:hypothetical protein